MFHFTVTITTLYNKMNSKKIKTMDNIELDNGTKFQKLKILKFSYWMEL